MKNIQKLLMIIRRQWRVNQGGQVEIQPKIILVAVIALSIICFYQSIKLASVKSTKIATVIESYSMGYQQGQSDTSAYYNKIVKELSKKLMEKYPEQTL